MLTYHFKKETRSTQLDAIELSKTQTNFIIYTNNQTNGIGRNNNSWIHCKNNVALSICIDKNLTQNHDILPLTSAISCYNLLNNKNIKLKWPNDIILNDKKIGGILINKINTNYIIGIGINITSSPKEIAESDYINKDIKDDFTKNICEKIIKTSHQSSNKIISSWLNLAWNLNKKITFTHTNKTKIEGIFTSLDKNGNIQIKTEEGLKTFNFGDVGFN